LVLKNAVKWKIGGQTPALIDIRNFSLFGIGRWLKSFGSIQDQAPKGRVAIAMNLSSTHE
jgi:hypothetical protein